MKINIDIKPISYYQYLSHNKFRKYITKKGREYKEELQKHFNYTMKHNEIFKKDVKLDIKLYFDNKRKNDIDNFVKPLMDCMSEIIFVDDRQVQELHLCKFYDKEHPRIEIIVTEFDS